jgi:hypothetical protein
MSFGNPARAAHGVVDCMCRCGECASSYFWQRSLDRISDLRRLVSPANPPLVSLGTGPSLKLAHWSHADEQAGGNAMNELVGDELSSSCNKLDVRCGVV